MFEINLTVSLTESNRLRPLPQWFSWVIIKCKCCLSVWTTGASNTFHIQNLKLHKALEVPKPVFRLLSQSVLMLAMCSKPHVGYYIISGSIWDLLNKSCWEDVFCHWMESTIHEIIMNIDHVIFYWKPMSHSICHWLNAVNFWPPPMQQNQ